jgi:cation diffusion facilitator family transporter
MVAYQSQKLISAALIGNALAAAAKFAAAAVTGSAAMSAEGFHSAGDAVNRLLLLNGLKRADRPPDHDHPHGHGREVYFWCFIPPLLVFGLGAGLSLHQGVRQLLHPTPIGDPAVNYVVLAAALAFEGATWVFAWRAFHRRHRDRRWFDAVRRAKDPSLFMVLFEHTAAVAGLLAAGLGLWLSRVTGDPLYDGLASIAIGLILAGTALLLALKTKGLLIGEAAWPEVVDGIRELARAHAEIQRINGITTLHMGPDRVIVNLSLAFNDQASAADVEAALCLLDEKIKLNYPEVQKIFVETEPKTNPAPEADV